MREFKRREIDYSLFKKKIPLIYQVLHNKEEPQEFWFRVENTHHQVELYIPSYQSEDKKELRVEHVIFPNWYIDKDEEAFASISSTFTFNRVGKLLTFRFSKVKEEIPPDFPMKDHFIFYKKNTLAYPELFFKALNLTLVEIV